jgi:serine/threonine-protein kinase RsbW
LARASIGLGEESTVDLSIPAGQGMAGRVLASREPLIIDDLAGVTLVSPALRDAGHRSVVAVPMISEKRLLGVLHAGSRDLAHFTESDAELLGILADRLAVALDRVRLFEQQRRLAQVAAFLADTAKIMTEATDLTETLNRLAGAALPALGDICLIDVVDDGSFERIVARHRDPTQQDLVDRLRTDFPPDRHGLHPAVEVLDQGRTRWSASMSDEFLRATTHDDTHFALTKRLGFRSFVAVPIASEDFTLGVLTLVSCTRPFTADDAALAESLAHQVGAVVVKAQRLDRAVQTSHVLQQALLPSRLPDVPGIAAHSRYEAATQSLDVGGDFYDLMALPDGRAWFIIGDVAGHDRQAAAEMGQLRSAARVVASQGAGPAETLQALQACWDVIGFERLATALVGVLDPASGELSMASAGHPPALLVEQGRGAFLPITPTVPLGVAQRSVQLFQTTLRHDQVLLLYTDGVISERTWGIEEGMKRLMEAAQDGAGDLASICQAVLAMQVGRDDDVALLAIRLTG